MTKSELVDAIAGRGELTKARAELLVNCVLEAMMVALERGEGIEIRGFGSFSLHYRPPRVGRNPKSGDPVSLPGKYVPHFKPGKELRERVNALDEATLEAARERRRAAGYNDDYDDDDDD
jgi:integration host factor subunit beta